MAQRDNANQMFSVVLAGDRRARPRRAAGRCRRSPGSFRARSSTRSPSTSPSASATTRSPGLTDRAAELTWLADQARWPTTRPPGRRRRARPEPCDGSRFPFRRHACTLIAGMRTGAVRGLAGASLGRSPRARRCARRRRRIRCRTCASRSAPSPRASRIRRSAGRASSARGGSSSRSQRTGARLAGTVFAPPARAARRGRHPLVVIVPGSGGTAREEHYHWSARELAAHGYVVVGVDPQGVGRSATFGEDGCDPAAALEDLEYPYPCPGVPFQQRTNFDDAALSAIAWGAGAREPLPAARRRRPRRRGGSLARRGGGDRRAGARPARAGDRGVGRHGRQGDGHRHERADAPRRQRPRPGGRGVRPRRRGARARARPALRPRDDEPVRHRPAEEEPRLVALAPSRHADRDLHDARPDPRGLRPVRDRRRQRCAPAAAVVHARLVRPLPQAGPHRRAQAARRQGPRPAARPGAQRGLPLLGVPARARHRLPRPPRPVSRRSAEAGGGAPVGARARVRRRTRARARGRPAAAVRRQRRGRGRRRRTAAGSSARGRPTAGGCRPTATSSTRTATRARRRSSCAATATRGTSSATTTSSRRRTTAATCSLWSQDRTYQWTNKAQPELGHHAGGYGYLRAGDRTISTLYADRPDGRADRAALRDRALRPADRGRRHRHPRGGLRAVRRRPAAAARRRDPQHVVARAARDVVRVLGRQPVPAGHADPPRADRSRRGTRRGGSSRSARCPRGATPTRCTSSRRRSAARSTASRPTRRGSSASAGARTPDAVAADRLGGGIAAPVPTGAPGKTLFAMRSPVVVAPGET